MSKVRALQLATTHGNLPPCVRANQPRLPARHAVYARYERPGGPLHGTPSGAYRKALWAALAAFLTLLLVVLVTIYIADENTTDSGLR
jgi:hypothetical protein